MLRPYQQSALSAMLADSGNSNNSIVSLPTGAGKSWVIAEYAKQLNQDVLILAPSKELVEQNIEKLILSGVDESQIGKYTASLNSKTIKKYTFGIVNSVVKHPEDFIHFTSVVVDECHDVDINKNGTMYQSLFRRMGSPKITGLTATPWRNTTTNYWQDGHMVAITKLEVLSRGNFWHDIIFNMNNADLTPEYLCPLIYSDQAIIDPRQIPLLSNGTDYHQERYAKWIQPQRSKVVQAIIDAKKRFKSILVFCPTVDNALELHQIFEGSGMVSGKTPGKERKDVLSKFKSGEIQVIFNVEVLTTGFDHPSLDCIILNRPVKSLGLYYQMLGRGVRQAEGKQSCNVIDLTGTSKSFGGIHNIKIVKYDDWELLTPGHSWHDEVIGKFTVKR